MPNKGPIIIIVTGILVIVGLVVFAANQDPQERDTSTETSQVSDTQPGTETDQTPTQESTQSMNTTPAPTNQISPSAAEPVNITLDNGLVIEDTIVGDGAVLNSGDSAEMHYTLYLSDGSKNQSSKDFGQPFTTRIGVGQVIPGWDQGIPGMKVGGTRKLTIPSDLAYGDTGQGDIPPGETLTFEVELLAIS